MRYNRRLKKYCKRLTAAVLIAGMTITGSYYGDFSTYAKTGKQKVALNAISKKLQKGKTFTLKVKNVPKNIKSKKIKFTSSKKSVASVTAKGKVKGNKVGKAVIWCKVSYKEKKKIKGKTKWKSFSKTLKCNVRVVAKKVTPTNTPKVSENPMVTAKPTATAGQTTTAKPTATAGQTTTAKPTATADQNTTTAGQDTTAKPTATAGQDTTAKPTATVGQTTTAKPTATAGQNTTAKPTAAASQIPAAAPTAAVSPTPTVPPIATSSPTPTATASPTPTATPTRRPATETASEAYQMVHDLGLGINLGNTMESVSRYKLGSVNAYETCWGAPTTTKAMIDGMKNAGFKTIRIPVAWSNMVSDDGNYTISDGYFNRVEEIMGYALDNDMYVIVNIHYDGGWWGQFGACKKDSAGNIVADETRRAAAWKRYESYWKQISERFKKYSGHVIFESANEELGTRLNDALNSNGYGFTEDMSSDDIISGNLTDDEKYALVNQINQKFVDIVRASGGNNANRFLLIAGYDTDISKTCDTRYKMPTDTIESHLMVSVHYYSPYGYCDIAKPSKEGYIASWGSDDEISTLKSDFKKMKLQFVDKGYPVIIGEYNVCDTENSDGTYTRKTGREVFIRNVCEYALVNGMCPVLWDTGMGYSRSQCRMSNDIDKELFEGLYKKAESGTAYVPDETKNEYVWTGNIGASANWNVIAPTVTDENWNFSITGLGAAYQLSGVDLTKFTNPYLEIKINSLAAGSSGSVSYKVGNKIDGNQGWQYVNDSDSKKSGTFKLSTGASLKIDLSKCGFSGYDNIYVTMIDAAFNANVTITIKDSSN